jgi:fumarate hydratase class II
MIAFAFLMVKRSIFKFSNSRRFPTSMHIAAVVEINKSLIPAMTLLRDAMAEKERSFQHIIKIGRTHLQDAGRDLLWA